MVGIRLNYISNSIYLVILHLFILLSYISEIIHKIVKHRQAVTKLSSSSHRLPDIAMFRLLYDEKCVNIAI